MPKYTLFRPRIRSRHPSHGVLRAKHKRLPLFPFKSVVRFGSSTEMTDTVSRGGDRIEVNTVEAIRNSASKLRMKQAFEQAGVKTAVWTAATSISTVDDLIDSLRNQVEEGTEIFPIVSKRIFGSRGLGNTIHRTEEDFRTWAEGKELDKYIFEKYYNYVREYRLHVTSDGCFYTCRKMLRSDAPDDARWFRNDQNCVWILEDNESFDKPSNWEAIEAECVKALEAVGLDFGAIDLRVQSATNRDGIPRENPEFIVVEINSAPSFGERTVEKYVEILPQILNKKYENLR